MSADAGISSIVYLDCRDNIVLSSTRRIFLSVLTVLSFIAVSGAGLQAEIPPHAQYPSKLINLKTGYVLGYGQATKAGLGESGFGVGHRVQFTTNTLLDLLTFVNGEIKLSLLEDRLPFPALSVSLGYYSLLSSEFIVDTVVHEAFADEEMSLDSGLDCLTFSASASKRVYSRTRVHLSFQYYHLEGEVRTKEPFTLSTEEGDMGLEMSLDQSAHHSCLLGGFDFDLLDHLKLMVELGYDITRDAGRGAAGFRLGLMRSFAVQAGVIWPGLELEDDIDVPVLPHFSFFWRF